MNSVNYIYHMRIAAIIFIILSVVANFIFNTLPVFMLAMFSFPVLLWLLLKKKKPHTYKRPAIKTNELNEPVD